MDNILYLDDYINLYNKKKNTIISIKPYKKTLRNGIVIDREKFIKKYNKEREKYNLNENIFNENISVIINTIYTTEDKLLLKNILEELNYKNIKFIQEIEYLKINKNDIYINYNNNYFYILYLDNLGNTLVNLYKNDELNRSIIINIMNYFNNKNIIIYGKNIKEFKNILEKAKINYYFFEDSENLVLKIIINQKSVKFK